MRTKQTMCPLLVLHDQSSAGEPLRRALAGKLEKSSVAGKPKPAQAVSSLGSQKRLS
jgi:hypothetical protein